MACPGGKDDRNGFIIFRVQQVISAKPYISKDVQGTKLSRLTADWVYANKYLFKDLIKAADLSWWNKYSQRSKGSTDWLPYNTLKNYANMIWGTQAGWHNEFEEHTHMEIESVRDLAPGEAETLFGSKSDEARNVELDLASKGQVEAGRALGGGGCRKLVTGSKQKDGVSSSEELLGGGGGGCAPPPPPPPSPFRPEILITYYYVFIPANLGFSSMLAARNSFNNAVNNWPGYDFFNQKSGYQQNFVAKLSGSDFMGTNLATIDGLTTTQLWVSDPAAADGVPTMQPVGMVPGGSGLANSTSMPYFGYIFVVLFLLLALGIIYFFCSKKAKLLESKDETFFTGKKQDEEILKSQAAAQEVAMATMEQQFMRSIAPPPQASPNLGRKSIAVDMGHNPHAERRFSTAMHY